MLRRIFGKWRIFAILAVLLLILFSPFIYVIALRPFVLHLFPSLSGKINLEVILKIIGATITLATAAVAFDRFVLENKPVLIRAESDNKDVLFRIVNRGRAQGRITRIDFYPLAFRSPTTHEFKRFLYPGETCFSTIAPIVLHPNEAFSFNKCYLDDLRIDGGFAYRFQLDVTYEWRFGRGVEKETFEVLVEDDFCAVLSEFRIVNNQNPKMTDGKKTSRRHMTGRRIIEAQGEDIADGEDPNPKAH